MPMSIKASFKLGKMHLDEMVAALPCIEIGIQTGDLVNPQSDWRS